MRALVLLLLTHCTALGAPVPPARPIQVYPGVYFVECGTRYEVTLYEGGSYVCGGWKGTWHWDKATRLLVIHEQYMPDEYPKTPVTTWLVKTKDIRFVCTLKEKEAITHDRVGKRGP